MEGEGVTTYRIHIPRGYEVAFEPYSAENIERAARLLFILQIVYFKTVCLILNHRPGGFMGESPDIITVRLKRAGGWLRLLHPVNWAHEV